MDLNEKIISGLERISEVYKSLLWDKAKVYGISPIQIQILIFVANHRLELSNVSYLAMEFGVTKPTISDAVRVLLKKELLVKDFSPTDNRRYNLLLAEAGKKLFEELMDYTAPVSKELSELNEAERSSFFQTLTKLIYGLNQAGILQVQRTCFGCRFYQGDQRGEHYCKLLEKRLQNVDLRLDCPDYSTK
ncbi:MAG: MarR family winged helix-turn-helix transcriptional regulator [Bacteroidota bacterium]